ncbi:LysR substrate-binding domain-containing protein [Ferrovibrio terrae]|uniref:LysR substrate-binding domain-containing protein n=1 Tax=Ferrovibrio terrae TaxID=2594003 RepID=UPI0031377623
MDLKQLQYFVSVVEAGGFSRAASALNLAQPSLSRQIALLEEELEQRLLIRTGRGVVPTEAGAALLQHARSMLDTARRAQGELRDLHSSPSGRIAVGLPPRVAVRLGVPLVQRFRQRFPRAVITLIEGLTLGLREQLIGAKLDLALLFDPQPSPLLEYRPLMRERLLLFAPKDTALPARLGLAALADYPMILAGAPNAIRAQVDAAIRPKGIELKVVAEVGAVQTALALVMAGVGSTILPESAQHLHPGGSKLPRAPIGPPALWNSLVLALPRTVPGSRLVSGTAQLIRELDIHQVLPGG